MSPGLETFDVSVEARDLARLFYGLSDAVDNFALAHPLPEADQKRLTDEADALEKRAHLFTAKAIGQTLLEIQPGLTHLKQTAADANKAVANLNAVETVISIATVGVALAAAIASGDVAMIASATEDLAKAIGPDAE